MVDQPKPPRLPWQTHRTTRTIRPGKNLTPFKLLRYFSITSLIAFIIVIGLLERFSRQSAIDDLRRAQERQHITLTQVFANVIWPTHAPLMAALSGLDPATLRARPEIASLRQDVLNQMRDTSVIKVKVYSPSGLTIFSTEPGEIGEDQRDDDGVIAGLAGQVDSELTHRDTINTFDRVLENRDVFSSYIPLHSAASGPEVVGVFEIYTDVTPFLQQIAQTQLRVAGGVALTLAVLYSVLFVIVQRADRILYREALERQRAAERPWRQALTFENTHDSVVVTQLDGTIIDCNPATERIFGAAKARLIGGSLCWYHPDALAQLQVELAAAPALRRAGTLPFTRADGGEGVCEVVVLPQYDQQEQPSGWIWISHDISERMRAEAALIAARDAAEAASRAKSMFLANMSHELRTPLTAILGYSDLIAIEATEQQSPQITSSLAAIQTAGRHLLALITDLLNLSRIEVGHLELQPEAVDIADLLAEVIALTQPLVSQNANTLDVHAGPNLGLMWADPGKLRQVLLNVLGNAAKFTHQGQITLTAAREAAADGDWIRFSVADTGIGIAREQLQQLFQPFMQADSSATRKYGGAGLGLAISGRICALMGGQIAVASEPGVGSTFLIALPAIPAGGSGATRTPPALAAPAIGDWWLNGLAAAR